MYYAVICGIAKDENEYLTEWVSYHLAIGFEHIFLFDNNSKQPVSETLAPYVERDIVTVINFPINKNQQLSAYYTCHKKLSTKAHWIAFIDIDEFIVPLICTDIRDLLDKYIDYPALGIHWKIFSSNGHISKPKGLVIENFTEFLHLNPHIKSIVQPQFTAHPISPHHFSFSYKYCVNEDYVCVPSFTSYPIANKIVINHYYYKSQQEFEEKIERGLATPVKNGRRTLDTFYKHLQKTGTKDTNIIQLANKIRTLMNMSASEMKSYINSTTTIDAESLKEEISLLYTRGKSNLAKEKYTKLKRYISNEDGCLFDIYLAVLQKDCEKARNILSLGLTQYPNIHDKLYMALEKIYEIKGNTQTKQSIINFIHEQRTL